jgi:putative hemolysin
LHDSNNRRKQDAASGGTTRNTAQARLAHSESEILEAQRLRYRVFAEELGANLPSRTPGVDHDLYGPFCEHLIVRDENNGRIVGTYLRSGAHVCGEPAWDPGFNTADLFLLLLPMSRIDARYARHFVERRAA